MNAPKHFPVFKEQFTSDTRLLIYLIENERRQAEPLSRILQAEGHRLRVFSTLAEFRAVCMAMRHSEEEPPDAVVMDMSSVEDVGGLQAPLKKLRECGATAIPVIAVSVHDDIQSRLAALRAGVTRYLVKPVDSPQLVDLLDTLAGRRPAEPIRVLLVDDDRVTLSIYAAILNKAGMEVSTSQYPLQILEYLDAFRPDVLILDLYMPDISGIELAEIVRGIDALAALPILFLSSETDVSQQLAALNLGNEDFLVKPINPDYLVSVVSRRAHSARRINALQRRMQTTLYEREREHLAVDHHAIVSVTDRNGNITYANDKFCDMSGYTRQELIGRNHRLLKSGEHPPEFYQRLWYGISHGRIWQGDICNRRKDGSIYWVASTITPFLDDDGRPYQYVSIRTDITHVKATAAALRDSEERLRRGQIYANVGTWDWNIQTGHLFWTERIAPLFGYPQGELETSYENFLKAVHPDDRQRVSDAVTACVERGEPYEIEHRVVWPDGTVRWLLEKGAVQRDADGRALQMLGVVQDIDDSKRAEMALAEREQQLVEAQALAHIGNWAANMITGELQWSDEIYRIFGHEPRSITPSVDVFFAAVHPQDRPKVIASEKLAEQTGLHDVVHRIVRPDGSVRHVHEMARMEKDDKGKVLRLAGTVQDITERIEAEEKLNETQARLAFAVEGTGDGVWEWNLPGESFTMSGNFEGMLGYAQGELTPAVAMLGQQVHPDDFAATQKKLQKCIEGELAVLSMEFRMRCKNGSYKWIMCRGTVVARDGNGRPVRMIGINSDIDALKRAEAELILARDEAERANQAKSEFLSSMSHELRTPMNAILGFGQLMSYDSNLDQGNQENVREILNAGCHLLNLINDVLDLARIESEGITLALACVDVQSIIEECLQLTRQMADARGIGIRYSVCERATIRSDRIKLKQAVLNLLSNAIKYNRDGGSIMVRVQENTDATLRISIADTGPGIAAHKMQDLFQPFNRLGAENSNVEGTGIGLTITQRIVGLMGGKVGVESELGVGSTFWIDLPIESIAPRVDDKPAAPVPQASITAGRDSRTQTVLYIEDNPSNLRLVAQILELRQSVRLLTAQTPERGIELAKARYPDLVLLDIALQGMDGYKVLDVFKGDASLRAIPVVAVTANAMEFDVRRGLQAGFDDYLTKPLDIPHFLATLDRHLGNDPAAG